MTPTKPKIESLDEMKELLTVAQAVEQSGFSLGTIRRHIQKGALPSLRVGPTRRVRIRRVDFVRYLQT